MRFVRPAAGVLALLAAGCAVFRGEARRSPATERRLSREEADFAQALAHFAHGIILEVEAAAEDDATNAVAAFGEAARLDPATPMLSDLHAAGLLRQGRVDEALAALERRCRLAPSAAAHAAVAQVAEAGGRADLALRHYAAAARLEPAEPAWTHAQARLLFKAGRHREALRQLRAALREVEDPGQRAAIHSVMAAGELHLGHTNAARRAFAAAAAQDPSDPVHAYRLAGFDLMVDGEAATNRWLKAAAGRDPDPVALLALARLAIERREWPAAREHAERAAEICRRRTGKLSADFHALLGHVREEAGDLAAAEAILQEGLATHPGNARLQNHLAYFWAVHNMRLEEAERLVEEALRQEPHNGAFTDTLGWVYFRQGRLKEALAKLALAVKLEGEDPVILDHLGDTLFALGHAKEAATCWRRSLALDPEAREVAEKLRRLEE